MVQDVNKTLADKNITVSLTDNAIEKIVSKGNDPRLGARPMRRAIQQTVENSVANKILSGQVKSGDRVLLDVQDLTIE
jgi:ATP-dependent Clp protease ATP-binding subunit ClpA